RRHPPPPPQARRRRERVAGARSVRAALRAARAGDGERGRNDARGEAQYDRRETFRVSTNDTRPEGNLSPLKSALVAIERLEAKLDAAEATERRRREPIAVVG